MKKYHAGKFGTKQILVLAVALVILLSMGAGPFVHASTSGATLTTDKQDYSPTQIVYITGNGFTPSPNVVITVQRPDLSVQSCVLSSTPGFLDPCPTTSSFTVRYQLDGILGTYVVTATTVTDNVQTSFTDSNAALDQCRNGPVSAPAPCNNGLNKGSYENGDATKSQAHWQEGNFMPYRVTVSGVAAGTHTLVFSYDTVHGGKHAIDYLGSFDATETTSATPTSFHANNNNPCIDVLLGAQAAQCTPASPVNTLPVLPATLVNCATSSGGPPASQVPGSFKIWGPAGTTLNSMTYVSQNVVSGTGQCSTTVSLSFTIGGTGSPTAVIAWGGHIASQADWGFGNSASAISGSPYHMSLNTLDGAPQGSQDRALEAAAIFFTPSISTAIFNASTNLPLCATNTLGTWSACTPTVTVGTTVYDNATFALGSISSGATGTVTFQLRPGSTCTGTVLATSSSLVSGGRVTMNSATFTPTIAGFYSFNATYGGDSQDFPASSACEPLVVVQATIGTVAVSPVNLGSSVSDTATVMVNPGSATVQGTVVFNLYGPFASAPTSTSCSAASLVFGPNSKPIGPLAGSASATSDPFTPTLPGFYAWVASYTPAGPGNGNSVSTTCGDNGETSIVVKATISTNVSHATVGLGGLVSDTATVTLIPSSATVSGTVDFTAYGPVSTNTPTCTTTNVAASIPGVPISGPGTGATATASFTPTAQGFYFWVAKYNTAGPGNGNSVSTMCGDPNETVEVMQNVVLTDTSFCPLPNNQFNLIYITDPANPSGFRMVASNPGQFYDNVFNSAPTGVTGTMVTITITIPYPFVTQGSVPIQVSSMVSTVNGCFVPSFDLTSQFMITTTGGNLSPSGHPVILLSDYSPQNIGSFTTITVKGLIPSTDLVYVTVHLNYGLKGTTGWTGGDTTGGVATNTGLGVTIGNPQSYSFSFTDTSSGSTSPTSVNIFKKDPGIAGVVLASDGTPIAGVRVYIYDNNMNLVAKLVTDDNGVYLYEYKYTGTPVTYTVSLPDYNISTTLTLSSNALVIADFQRTSTGGWQTSVIGKHN